MRPLYLRLEASKEEEMTLLFECGRQQPMLLFEMMKEQLELCKADDKTVKQRKISQTIEEELNLMMKAISMIMQELQPPLSEEQIRLNRVSF